jgi:hypothetical protein
MLIIVSYALVRTCEESELEVQAKQARVQEFTNLALD